jgi:hypothetical protein
VIAKPEQRVQGFQEKKGVPANYVADGPGKSEDIFEPT